MVQVAPEAPAAFRWSRERYDRAVELGLLEGERVELLQGRIVQMSPTFPSHASHVEEGRKVLSSFFAADLVYVRKEDPLALGDWDEPEPDLAVVVGTNRDYREAHPTAAQTLLVVEVAETTARRDLDLKADVYASAGIEDYWVVLPDQRAVVVCREPAPMGDDATVMRYRSRRTYRAGEMVAPLAAPERPLAVEALLL
jgi:Uma2 family endonuclease